LSASGSPARLSVPLITTALAVILVAVAAELLAVGFNEDAVHLALRTTARTSAILFAFAVAAPAIPLLRSREDSLLVAFAGSHLIHLVAIVTLATFIRQPRMLADPLGITAYACIIGVAARILWAKPLAYLPRWYPWIEGAALLYVWATLVRIFSSNFSRSSLHAGFTLMLVAAIAARVAAAFDWKRATATPR